MATIYSLSYIPQAILGVIKFAEVSFFNDPFTHYLSTTIGFILYITSALFDPLLTLLLKDDFKRTTKRLMKRHCIKLSGKPFRNRTKKDLELDHPTSTIETSLLPRDESIIERSRLETSSLRFDTSSM